MSLGTVTSIEDVAEFEHDPQDFYDGLPQASQDLWDAIAAKGWTPGHISLGFVADKDGLQIGPFESIAGLYSCVNAEEDGLPKNDANEDESEEGSIFGGALPEDAEVVDGVAYLPDDEEGPEPSGALCGTPSPDNDGRYCRLDMGHRGDCILSQPPSLEDVGVEIDEDHKGNVYLPGVKPLVDATLATAAGDFFAANTDWKDAGKLRKEKLDTLSTVANLKRDLFRPDPDNSNSLIYHAGGLLIRIAKEQKTTVSVEADDDGK